MVGLELADLPPATWAGNAINAIALALYRDAQRRWAEVLQRFLLRSGGNGLIGTKVRQTLGMSPLADASVHVRQADCKAQKQAEFFLIGRGIRLADVAL